MYDKNDFVDVDSLVEDLGRAVNEAHDSRQRSAIADPWTFARQLHAERVNSPGREVHRLITVRFLGAVVPVHEDRERRRSGGRGQIEVRADALVGSHAYFMVLVHGHGKGAAQSEKLEIRGLLSQNFLKL